MQQQRPHLLSLKYGQILHRDTRHEGKLCCGKSYDRDAHKGGKYQQDPRVSLTAMLLLIHRGTLSLKGSDREVADA